MRYQKNSERRAVILMVVLSLLTLFALVGVSFVLYADAEAAAARVARESQTAQIADVKPEDALSFFLNQLIYDAPDTTTGALSGLRGHSLARTMYGLNYVVPPGPSLNLIPFNGVGRVHYASPLTYPVNPLTNVPPNWGTQLDDYAMVNYTWFSGDGFVRDPERFGVRNAAQLLANTQTNPYVGGNAPYTYPDLNNFFLAAMRADGTVLTPSYHRPWLFQVVNGKFYAFNDMTNPNWTFPHGKYLTLRPRPAEHPGLPGQPGTGFPPPGDATGDVKNLPWAPGGNDSIWVDLGAPVMTAPDGTKYKMMFAPLIIDLDGRVNLNTAGNVQAYVAAMAASSAAGVVSNSAAWQAASAAHVSNQGWGPWEVNLSKVLWGDQVLTPYPQSTPPTPPEWIRLFTGVSYATTTMPPNTLPFIAQPGIIPPTPLPVGLSAWLLPGVRGRYLQTGPLWTPNAAGLTYLLGAPGVNGTYAHAYAQEDFNALNELINGAASSRPLLPGSPANVAWGDPAPNLATNPFASFQQGYGNGTAVEGLNHPLLYNVFQSPLFNSLLTRTFRASDMEALLRPSISVHGPSDGNASSVDSDLMRLSPANFPAGSILSSLPPNLRTLALRYRNLVTTQSWDMGAPGVIPYWWNGMDPTGYLAANATNYLLAPSGGQPQQTVAGVTSFGFPPLPPTLPTSAIPSEFGPDWRSLAANVATYFPTTNPAGYVTPGARIRLNRPLPPYPHMGALVTPPYTSQAAGAAPSPYGVAYNLTPGNPIVNQFTAAQFARQALANDIYRRLLAITGLPAIPMSPPGVSPPPLGTSANPNSQQLAPRRWLAQLAVNIVDYIDEDDIMTPFNFYTVQDNYNQPLATPANIYASNPVTTSGPDDNDATIGNRNTTPTGANPDYWVFGTELPKVVLNEALAEAQNTSTTQTPVSGESVKVWVELYNTMPATGGTNTQPQDQNRVPLYVSIPSGGGYSPYCVTIAQSLMNQNGLLNMAPYTTSTPAGMTAELQDVSANVLGKGYVGNTNTVPVPTTSPLPQSTSIPGSDFTNPPTTPNATLQLSNGGAYPAAGVGTNNVGVDAGGFFLIGPSTNLNNYLDPFSNFPANVKVPVLRTDNVTYTPTAQSWKANSSTDERTTGLTVLLRRLANPYLPPQVDPTRAYYNPYVTVDFLQPIPIRPTMSPGGSTWQSFGKTQPFASLIIPNSISSPVKAQIPNPNPPPPQGAVVTNINNRSGASGTVQGTFGFANFPLPISGRYDWLVHLDRPPISPMELLHVSAFPPYMLTQYFIQGDVAANVATTTVSPSVTPVVSRFGHYAPWFDSFPTGMNVTNMNCPWWFDPSLARGSSHRLYRLFDFLECGDRAFGVNGLGRIPGKVNINTVWDPEILQALIDANMSMGTTTTLPAAPLSYAPINPASGQPWNPAPTADLVSQIFANMLLSRSPAYYNQGIYIPPTFGTNPYPLIGPVNMGTVADDRPFMPLSTGQYLPFGGGGGLQFPGSYNTGIGVTADTILRTNNPFGRTGSYPAPGPAANTWLLFQNYTDSAATAHPYYQTQLLTKLYNNITTRSNTFAVFVTVGFFQVQTDPTTGAVLPAVGQTVIPGMPYIPQLGPEIGRTEGKQIRHRMFAIVDRTNLTTFTTTGQAVVPGPGMVTGPTPNIIPGSPPTFNPTGLQTIQIPSPVPPPNATVTVNPANPTASVLVANPLTGFPGVIQAGTQLVIDPGNFNEETVTVISVTPPKALGMPAYFTANFTLPHGVGNTPFTIVQRGNPGPWVLTPYDPRLDSSVVRYFSIID